MDLVRELQPSGTASAFLEAEREHCQIVVVRSVAGEVTDCRKHGVEELGRTVPGMFFGGFLQSLLPEQLARGTTCFGDAVAVDQ